ncbi:MAG: hypothetical protein P8129_21360, partial [Anaerolineae bacterium]
MQLRHGGRALADVWTRIDRQALLEDEHRFSAHDYGLRLYDAVLTGAVGRAYQRLIGRAGPDEALRVQLEIHPDAPELQALPWERLFHVFGDAEVALAADAHTPFSRFLTSGAGDVPPVEAPVLRLLVAIANPEGLPAGCAPLDVAGEAERLAGVLARLGGRTRSHSESKKPKRFLHSQHVPWHAAKHENAGRPGPGIAEQALGDPRAGASGVFGGGGVPGNMLTMEKPLRFLRF